MNAVREVANYIERYFQDEYGMTLAELKQLAELKRDGKLIELPCKPGDEVWVIERDEDGSALDYSCLVFVCKVFDYCIASMFYNDLTDIADLLEQQSEETIINFNGSLCVYPACDCYATKEEAEAKLKELQNDLR